MDPRHRDRKRVLVVDDDVWIRSMLADLLAREGYLVDEASNGWTALRLARQQPPDVILLDLALPERSGPEVLHELRAEELTRDIPILVATAHRDFLTGSDTWQADGLLQKPFDWHELLAQVERAALTGRSRLGSALIASR